MGPVGATITFLLIWWLVFFAVLPMRVKGVWEDEGEHAKGSERGAPVNPELWWKIKRTTLIAAGLSALVFVVIASGVFDPLGD